MSKSEFANEVLSVLEETYPEDEFIYDAKEDRIDSTEGDENTNFLFLGNIYNNAKYMDKDERLEYLKTFIGESKANEQGVEVGTAEFLRTLMFRIRVEADFAFRPYYLPKDYTEQEPLRETIGDVYLELVSDSELSVSTLNDDQLKDHGISKERAFERARKNLRDITPRKMWTKLDKHIWQSDIYDDFDAARLVAIYDDLNLPFKGEPILFMPAHGVALITGSSDPKVIEEMVDEGMEQAKDQRVLSYALWKKEGDVWRQWKPKKSEPAYEFVTLQNMQILSMNYDEQNRLLAKRHEETGEDIFIASYSMYRDEAGVIFTTAVYPVGVVTYIPEVERITIVDTEEGKEGELLGSVTWSEFIEILNPPVLLKSYPKLYDLSETPTGVQQKRLKTVMKKL